MTKNYNFFSKSNCGNTISLYYETKKKPSLLNKKKSKSNTSGVKGVYWKKDKNMWDVEIGFQKKRIHIGYFKKFEDAVKARKRAEEQYFEPILNKYGKELL